MRWSYLFPQVLQRGSQPTSHRATDATFRLSSRSPERSPGARLLRGSGQALEEGLSWTFTTSEFHLKCLIDQHFSAPPVMCKEFPLGPSSFLRTLCDLLNRTHRTQRQTIRSLRSRPARWPRTATQRSVLGTVERRTAQVRRGVSGEGRDIWGRVLAGRLKGTDSEHIAVL
ncbi:hypothetical protein AAFF_G00199000 [Aldrovandia affinis]|uniref:Uncharacterized protein n=1 Tax=Aldrovandia affinis TaxID=143900 RepID=A0AAD7RI70_9TELE|nr:hypothetical protein AAFF_G00199000 [Aldrovandia affinis]